ncbi:uncharacterized protein LOC133887308 [Phragmites australis]|uniref:uncharacterized protein LOC133887308 n=1 Tax=Phragmites australis TaxID=29695 RepID=UPI002D76967D|nr:uncharacterized protein LOC133887308 [Phragmites australis]
MVFFFFLGFLLCMVRLLICLLFFLLVPAPKITACNLIAGFLSWWLFVVFSTRSKHGGCGLRLEGGLQCAWPFGSPPVPGSSARIVISRCTALFCLHFFCLLFSGTLGFLVRLWDSRYSLSCCDQGL